MNRESYDLISFENIEGKIVVRTLICRLIKNSFQEICKIGLL